MEVLYILIPLSLILAAGFTIACVTAIKSGQYKDLESPKWRILFDEQSAKDINEGSP